MNRQQKSGFGVGLGWAMAVNRNMKLEVDALFGEKGAKASLEYAPEDDSRNIQERLALVPVPVQIPIERKGHAICRFGPGARHHRFPSSAPPRKRG